MSPTCFPDRCRPPEAGPIVRNIKHRSGILLPVWCRHAGFSRKSSSRTSTNPNSSKNPSRTPRQPLRNRYPSKILQVCSWLKNGRKRLLQPHPTSRICIRQMASSAAKNTVERTASRSFVSQFLNNPTVARRGPQSDIHTVAFECRNRIATDSGAAPASVAAQ